MISRLLKSDFIENLCGLKKLDVHIQVIEDVGSYVNTFVNRQC